MQSLIIPLEGLMYTQLRIMKWQIRSVVSLVCLITQQQMDDETHCLIISRGGPGTSAAIDFISYIVERLGPFFQNLTSNLDRELCIGDFSGFCVFFSGQISTTRYVSFDLICLEGLWTQTICSYSISLLNQNLVNRISKEIK